MSRVFCSNCGAEVILPEHSCVTTGITVSEKDTVGTHYLPTKESAGMTKAEERMVKLKAAGVDTSNYMVLTGADGNGFLFKNENGIPTPVLDDDPILAKIKESGYVFNRFVDPRWVTGQMFQMLKYKSWYNGDKGYDAALTAKGYNYQFTFLSDELKRLAKMEKEHDPHLQERGQFFNQGIVYDMLRDYEQKLRKYIKHLYKPQCKGVPYVRLAGFKNGNDNKGDVFLDDLPKKVYGPLNKKIWEIQPSPWNQKSFQQLSRWFDHWMQNYYIKFTQYEFRQSKVFRDTYKGLGAYYTCMNLIKFHGCCVLTENGWLGTDASIELVKKGAIEYRGEYWRLFAFMKKLIKDNDFQPDWK